MNADPVAIAKRRIAASACLPLALLDVETDDGTNDVAAAILANPEVIGRPGEPIRVAVVRLTEWLRSAADDIDAQFGLDANIDPPV